MSEARVEIRQLSGSKDGEMRQQWGSKERRCSSLSLLENLLEALYRDRLFPSVSMLRMVLDQHAATAKGETVRLGCSQPTAPETSHCVEELIEAARCSPEKFIVKDEKIPQPPSEFPTLLGCAAGSLPRSVTLVKPPQWFKGFVNPASDEDHYPSTFWSAFEKYLENLARLVRSKAPCVSAYCDGPHAFRGNFLGMAKEFQRRRLHFFDNMALGEICHIVQLAIHKRKLLVCDDNVITPMAATARCNAGIGELVAPRRTENVNCNADTTMVQTESELCNILRDLLSNCDVGLDLSKLKFKIFESTKLHLNEGVFGCTKVLDLFGLPEVTQLCCLKKVPGKSAYFICLRKAADDLLSVSPAADTYAADTYVCQEPLPSCPPFFGSQHLLPSPCQPSQAPSPANRLPKSWTPPMTSAQNPAHSLFHDLNAFNHSPPLPWALPPSCAGQHATSVMKHAGDHQRHATVDFGFGIVDVVPPPLSRGVQLVENVIDKPTFCKTPCAGLHFREGEPAYVPLPCF